MTGTVFAQVATSQDVAPRTDPSSTTESGCTFLATMADIQDSVFQIILNGPSGVELGTAFYIGDGEFLTAAHLVTGYTRARLRNAVADFPATVTAIDPRNDLALLRAGEPPGEPLRFQNSAGIRPGQAVAAVGYPLFEDYQASITGGLISRLIDDPAFGLLIQTDAPINRGNSGGPLVDQCGVVVGMAFEKWFEEGVDGVAWAISASSVEAALTGLRAVPAPVAPTVNVMPAGLPSARPQASLHVVGVLVEDYQDRIEAAVRSLESRPTDAAAQAEILWRLAEDTDAFRRSLDSDDLGDSGPTCELARRAYTRALGWTSRLAGYHAAQVWNPGEEYRSEQIEALWKSREIAAEAADYQGACAADQLRRPSEQPTDAADHFPVGPTRSLPRA